MKFIANYEWKRTWLVFNEVLIIKTQDKGIFGENFKKFSFSNQSETGRPTSTAFVYDCGRDPSQRGQVK